MNYHRERLRKLSEPLTVVIQPLSIRLIKPNFCFHLSHRRSTTVSLETRNPTFINDPEKIAHAQFSNQDPVFTLERQYNFHVTLRLKIIETVIRFLLVSAISTLFLIRGERLN